MTRVQVAIVEDAATFRRGLEDALTEAGMTVSAPPDVASWLAAQRKRTVVFSVRSTEQFDELAALSGGSTNVVVALLQGLSADLVAKALRAGASGVADWHDAPEAIVEVVTGALAGRTILPIAVARELAGSVPLHGAAPVLSDEEISWLMALANGSTVTKLADEVGYSERAMFRRLADLYARLGAHNRTEALLAADRHGLLSAAPAVPDL